MIYIAPKSEWTESETVWSVSKFSTSHSTRLKYVFMDEQVLNTFTQVQNAVGKGEGGKLEQGRRLAKADPGAIVGETTSRR